jgi:hypothetical protein
LPLAFLLYLSPLRKSSLRSCGNGIGAYGGRWRIRALNCFGNYFSCRSLERCVFINQTPDTEDHNGLAATMASTFSSGITLTCLPAYVLINFHYQCTAKVIALFFDPDSTGLAINPSSASQEQGIVRNSYFASYRCSSGVSKGH